MKKIYSADANPRRDLLQTMKMNETSPDIYKDGYMIQFQPGPIHKIQ